MKKSAIFNCSRCSVKTKKFTGVNEAGKTVIVCQLCHKHFRLYWAYIKKRDNNNGL